MGTVLVTGATGVVGSHLLPLLGGDVYAPGHREMDLSQPLDPDALPDDIHAVVYLAQSRHFRNPDAAEEVMRFNAEQPVALARAVLERGARKFVYASTGSVYVPSAKPLKESDPTRASGVYAASKLAAEAGLAEFRDRMNVQILRFFFIYGTGQGRDMLLPRLADRVAAGTPITLAGPDGMLLQPLQAGDAANAVVKALRLEGSHTINVAGPEVFSLRDVGEIIGAELGCEPRFEQENRVSEGELVADTRRMEDLLGQAKIRFADGVRSILP